MKFTKENSVDMKHKRTGEITKVLKSSLNTLHIKNSYDAVEVADPKEKPKPKPKPKAKPKKKAAKKKK